MRELFKKQLNGTKPLTEDILKKLKDKTYFNGEKKKVGDIVLIAMLIGDTIKSEGGISELPLKLITLNERHFDVFEYEERLRGSNIPTIKLRNQ